jgi:hypothetical protein
MLTYLEMPDALRLRETLPVKQNDRISIPDMIDEFSGLNGAQRGV